MIGTLLSMEGNDIPHDLGICAKEKQILLYSNIFSQHVDPFMAGSSPDGLHFKRVNSSPSIIDNDGLRENTLLCENFRASHLQNQYLLIYKKQQQNFLAFSNDGITWKKQDALVPFHETAMVVPDFSYKGSHLVYFGNNEIRIALTKDFVHWQKYQEPVLKPRHNYFDKYPIELVSTLLTPKGILLIYVTRQMLRQNYSYTIGAALFDKKNPTTLLWRSTSPLWEQRDDWKGKTIYPMGAAQLKERFIVYMGVEGDGVYAIAFPNLDEILSSKGIHAAPKLEKHTNNPIIAPVLKHAWEASATFNTAAVYEGGKVHLVYRAMGPNNTSVLGYAASSDGIHIDEREDQPIYVPTEPFEYPGKYPSIHFMSGGGYGGCEDPRITKVGDVFYMTYVAYNGSDPPRIALTSIKVDDFLNKRWKKWTKPKLISKPGVVNKNCVIFPEKINGKFVVIHRVFPNMLIDFVDDLTFDNTYLQTKAAIPPRDDSWDSRKLGAGAPPIKTKDGWLLIYQAVDDRDPGKYKIGAMLLDLQDPSIVLYRSHSPILEPSEWYENEGFKAGVAYPCGAVVVNNKLLVYYGGADTFICAASMPLDTFLRKLKKSGSLKKPEKVSPQKINHYLYAHIN